MTLYGLCLTAEISCPRGFEEIEVRGITSDSRKVGEGYIYICIKGMTVDGHAYISDATGRGAVCILCESTCPAGVPKGVAVICSDNTRRDMARLFAAWYGNVHSSLKIIGVTGTNGKTTVSRMIYEILHRSGIPAGLIGTTGNLVMGEVLDIRSSNELANLTTPDPEELYRIFSVMAARGARYVVMEVSSHALHLSKVSPIQFALGVFTNLTPEHLDLHGDMESYFEAKSRLFDQCERAVINCDDIYGRRLFEKYRNKAISCSARGESACALATDVRLLGTGGIEYRLSHPKLRTRIECCIPGEFTVMNSLEAAIASFELGVSGTEIKSALRSLSGIDGRLERVMLDRSVEFSVFIDYAHTPDALENLLRAARGFKRRGQRIVLLFGCGGDRDRSKRAQMGRIASAMADMVILTSDNSRSEDPTEIIGEILVGIDKESCFAVIEDRREAIEYAIKHARRGDIILLAGKGHERYEIIGDKKLDFCERSLVLEFASKYHHLRDT